MNIKINMTLFRILYHKQRLTLLFFGLCLILAETMIHWFLTSSGLSQGAVQFLKMLPPAIRKLFGEESVGLFTPLGLMTIGYTHPFVYFMFISYGAIFFGREITMYRERGILPLYLAKPISRTTYLGNLSIVFVAGEFIIGLFTLAGVGLSFWIFAVDQSLMPFAITLFNLFLLALCIGSIMMLISILVETVSQATGWMIGVSFILFLLEYTGRSIEEISFLSPINPFHYYRPQSIISRGSCSPMDCVILIMGFLIFTFLSLIAFHRKDI